jgi:hypothetical protein
MIRIITILLTMFSLGAYSDVAIVVNYDKDMLLTDDGLHRLLTGDKDRWPNGTKVVIVVLKKNNRIQREFIRRQLGFSISYYYRLYEKNKHDIFYDELIDEEDMIDVLTRTRGSVGLVGSYIYYSSDNLKTIELKN